MDKIMNLKSFIQIIIGAMLVVQSNLNHNNSKKISYDYLQSGCKKDEPNNTDEEWIKPLEVFTYDENKINFNSCSFVKLEKIAFLKKEEGKKFFKKNGKHSTEDYCQIINHKHFDRVSGYISSAFSDGASVVF